MKKDFLPYYYIINSNVNITDDSKINDNNTIVDNIDFDDIINATDNDKSDANNDDVIKNIRKVIKSERNQLINHRKVH